MTSSLVHTHSIDNKGQGIQCQKPLPIQETDSDSIQWVHIQYDAANANEYLQSLGVSESISSLIVMPETRPRSVSIDDGVFMVLRGVNTIQDADTDELVSLRIWVSGNDVITARRSDRKLHSIESMRMACLSGKGPASVGKFLVTIIETMTDRIGDTVESINEAQLDVETHLKESNPQEVRSKLAETRRHTAEIRRYLAPQREALITLSRIKSLLTEELSIELHHQIDRMTRYIEDLDLSRERALTLQAELQNQLSEKQNARMYLLSVVTAIFLPLSFLTGVFGVNVAGLPGTDNPSAFAILTGVMVAIGIGLCLLIFWKKWL